MFRLCVCMHTLLNSPGTRDTDGCESPCEFWEPNQGLLKEQVLLIAEQFSELQL